MVSLKKVASIRGVIKFLFVGCSWEWAGDEVIWICGSWRRRDSGKDALIFLLCSLCVSGRALMGNGGSRGWKLNEKVRNEKLEGNGWLKKERDVSGPLQIREKGLKGPEELDSGVLESKLWGKVYRGKMFSEFEWKVAVRRKIKMACTLFLILSDGDFEVRYSS